MKILCFASQITQEALGRRVNIHLVENTGSANADILLLQASSLALTKQENWLDAAAFYSSAGKPIVAIFDIIEFDKRMLDSDLLMAYCIEPLIWTLSNSTKIKKFR